MNRKERQQAAWTTAATIMTLAWPTIVEQVMQTAVQYIDTAFSASRLLHIGVSVYFFMDSVSMPMPVTGYIIICPHGWSGKSFPWVAARSGRFGIVRKTLGNTHLVSCIITATSSSVRTA